MTLSVAKVSTRANKASVATFLASASKGATFITGTGQNYLYAFVSNQESEVSLDFVTGMLKLFLS